MDDNDLHRMIEGEQARAGLQSLADLMGHYRGQLLMAGFVPDEAMELVSQLHAELVVLQYARNSDDD